MFVRNFNKKRTANIFNFKKILRTAQVKYVFEFIFKIEKLEFVEVYIKIEL